MMTGLIAAALLASTSAAQPGPVAATQPPAARPSPFVPVTTGSIPANPADVASVDAIMRAVYDVISGPAGQKRDWNRMRSLFTANARMMPKGSRGLMSGGVEDYISSSGPMLEERGFIEREIARRTEQYGDIAHVFSTYEARQSEAGRSSCAASTASSWCATRAAGGWCRSCGRPSRRRTRSPRNICAAPPPAKEGEGLAAQSLADRRGLP
jgi:hypothetical protein